MAEKTLNIFPITLLEKIGFPFVTSRLESELLTPEGLNRLYQLRPSADPGRVGLLNRQTGEMSRLLDEDITLPFEQLEEIEPWLRQTAASGSQLPVNVFLPIGRHARVARLLKQMLQRQGDTVPELANLAQRLEMLKDLEDSIEQTIDSEGAVRDGASGELRSLRKRLRNGRSSLRKSIERIYRTASRNGITSDEGPTLRNGRMVIPVRAEHKRTLDGFIHDLSSTGQTVYLEPVETLQLNNNLRQLEAEEKREVERILIQLTDRVRKHRKELLDNSRLMGDLDFIHARARFGRVVDGVIARRSEGQYWKLEAAMNPELLLKTQKAAGKDRPDAEQVIPLDMELGVEERGLLISGPNAGGKSVALKTVALLTALYQCGIPIPVAPGSELPIVSGLFLDLGDEQSIENDLSTFSSRLDWMNHVLAEADAHSLVLIDEAGTGTDPDEGGALFQAFIEKILDRDTRLIATTHHGTLKVFAHDHAELSNAAMEFDQKSLSPTYKFRKGAPGSSYAFEIAERMDLPAKLLERAGELLGSQRENLSRLLLNLEEQIQSTEKEGRNYRKLSEEAEKIRKDYSDRANELEENKKELLKEAYQEAEQIMTEANRKIEQAVEQIQSEGRRNKGSVRKARQRVTGHKEKIQKKLEEIGVQSSADGSEKAQPAVGDRVRMKDGETSGELLELEGNRAVVLTNGLRINTTLDRLVKSRGRESENQLSRWKRQSSPGGYRRETVSPSLNLRGMRGDEAVRTLTLYIDRAVAGGLTQVDIIHGKGDGILRKLVHEHLEGRKEVAAFELAPLERGGSGCTIVSFR